MLLRLAFTSLNATFLISWEQHRAYDKCLDVDRFGPIKSSIRLKVCDRRRRLCIRDACKSVRPKMTAEEVKRSDSIMSRPQETDEPC